MDEQRPGIFIESSDLEPPTEDPADHPDVKCITSEDVP